MKAVPSIGKGKGEDLPKKGKQRPINTSIPKLRVKYKWLKDQWRKITDIIKVASGKSPVNEPVSSLLGSSQSLAFFLPES